MSQQQIGLTPDDVRSLQRCTRVSHVLKNLALAFLTLFSSNLDDLIDPDEEANQSSHSNEHDSDHGEDNQEWNTIKCFFKNEHKVSEVSRLDEAQLVNIPSSTWKKAALILMVAAANLESRRKFPQPT